MAQRIAMMATTTMISISVIPADDFRGIPGLCGGGGGFRSIRNALAMARLGSGFMKGRGCPPTDERRNGTRRKGEMSDGENAPSGEECQAESGGMAIVLLMTRTRSSMSYGFVMTPAKPYSRCRLMIGSMA